MKTIVIAAIAILMTAFTGSVLAEKNGKEVRHCGCYYDSIDDEASMIYHDIFIAGKSKGHKNHVVSGEDFDDMCFDGLVDDEPVYKPFARTKADCEPDGADLDADLEACADDGEHDEFDTCGEEFIDPV